MFDKACKEFALPRVNKIKSSIYNYYYNNKYPYMISLLCVSSSYSSVFSNCFWWRVGHYLLIVIQYILYLPLGAIDFVILSDIQ